MKKGDEVIVYEDPITELKPEGKVKLIREISCGEAWYENRKERRWGVKFLSDGFMTERTIFDPPLNPEKSK